MINLADDIQTLSTFRRKSGDFMKQLRNRRGPSF